MSTRSATTAGRYAKRADFQDYIYGSSEMIKRACRRWLKKRQLPQDTLSDLSSRQCAAHIRKLRQMKEAA